MKRPDRPRARLNAHLPGAAGQRCAAAHFDADARNAGQSLAQVGRVAVADATQGAGAADGMVGGGDGERSFERGAVVRLDEAGLLDR